MIALSYYENISFEETICDNYFQLIVSVNDKKAETTRVIFQKKISLLAFIPLFITIAIVAIPFLVLLFLTKLIFWLFSLLHKDTAELSYEEAKEYFSSGKGYLNNLSVEEQQQLLTKRENSPF